MFDGLCEKAIPEELLRPSTQQRALVRYYMVYKDHTPSCNILYNSHQCNPSHCERTSNLRGISMLQGSCYST